MPLSSVAPHLAQPICLRYLDDFPNRCAMQYIKSRVSVLSVTSPAQLPTHSLAGNDHSIRADFLEVLTWKGQRAQWKTGSESKHDRSHVSCDHVWRCKDSTNSLIRGNMIFLGFALAGWRWQFGMFCSVWRFFSDGVCRYLQSQIEIFTDTLADIILYYSLGLIVTFSDDYWFHISITLKWGKTFD